MPAETAACIEMGGEAACGVADAEPQLDRRVDIVQPREGVELRRVARADITE
jgi:phage tail protein X